MLKVLFAVKVSIFFATQACCQYLIEAIFIRLLNHPLENELALEISSLLWAISRAMVGKFAELTA